MTKSGVRVTMNYSLIGGGALAGAGTVAGAVLARTGFSGFLIALAGATCIVLGLVMIRIFGRKEIDF